jgi:hypothetical protein
MNPRTKRPTASDLVPTAKAIKEMSYEANGRPCGSIEKNAWGKRNQRHNHPKKVLACGLHLYAPTAMKCSAANVFHFIYPNYTKR